MEEWQPCPQGLRARPIASLPLRALPDYGAFFAWVFAPIMHVHITLFSFLILFFFCVCIGKLKFGW